MNPNPSFEPQTRLMLATAMAESVNFMLRRDYLDLLSAVPACGEGFSVLPGPACPDAPVWIEIRQVGVPARDARSFCADAMQKLLRYCSHQQRVYFLAYFEENRFRLFMGIRLRADGPVSARRFLCDLKAFSASVWDGLACTEAKTRDPLQGFLDRNGFEKAVAVTGIPADGETASVDSLFAGMRGKEVAYLVCAEPLSLADMDRSLFAIREAEGQMESIRTMNLQTGRTLSATHADGVTWSRSRSRKDFEKVRQGVLGFLERDLGFKPAASYGKALAVGGLALGATALGATALAQTPVLLGGAGLAAGLLLDTVSEQEGGSASDTFGVSAAESLSGSIVNKHADHCVRKLEKAAQRLEAGQSAGMWSTTVCLLGESRSVDTVSRQLQALVCGKESTQEPIRLHDVTAAFERIGGPDLERMPRLHVSSSGEVLGDPFGRGGAEVATLLTTAELEMYFHLPAKAVDGIRTVPVTPEVSLRPPEAAGPALRLGKLLSGGVSTGMDCPLGIDALARHALVCGINGSGKTNTILGILSALQDRGIPFLVIEPVKSEYADWALRYNACHPERERIRVFMPGRESYSAPAGPDGMRQGRTLTDRLRFNPFEAFEPDYACPDNRACRTESHISLVKTLFSLAFPMQDILPTVLELLITHLFDQAAEEGRTPTLADMQSALTEGFVEKLGYDMRNTLVIKGALKTRLNSLRHGWRADLLDSPADLHTDWDDFFSHPVVLNLSAVTDDGDKALITGLAALFLSEYWQARSERPDFSYSSDSLSHLLVIEEAHRVMAAGADPDSGPGRVARFFANFLKEMRAYGEGLMVVDQVPGRLLGDAIDNTNLKLVHRIVSGTDHDALARAMGLSEGQKALLPRLGTGQCLVSGLGCTRIGETVENDVYWCLVDKTKDA